MEARDYVAALVERGFKQASIAKRTGIPQPTISKILRGEVKDVLSRNYRALQALHAEVDAGQIAASTTPVPGPQEEPAHVA